MYLTEILVSITDYIPIIVAFGSGLLAIFGGTWDSTKSGFDRLTKTGRCTFFLLVASAIISVITTRHGIETKNRIKNHRNEIAIMVKDDIDISIDNLLYPFREVYIDINGGAFINLDEITIEMLLDDSFTSISERICLEDRPVHSYSIPDKGTWRDIFTAGISSGVTRLEQLRLLHSANINAEVMKSIRELLVNGPLTHFARSQYKPDVNTNSKLPKCLISQGIGTHKEFISMIKKIHETSRRNVLPPA